MLKLPKQRFQLIFSLTMAAMMVFVMTFVITLANIGMPPDFFQRWAKAYLVAYCAAVPCIYFLAPIARKITARFVDTP